MSWHLRRSRTINLYVANINGSVPLTLCSINDAINRICRHFPGPCEYKSFVNISLASLFSLEITGCWIVRVPFFREPV
jgi:hypothetical protein